MDTGNQAAFGVKHYYQEELQHLRQDASEFARDYPAIAQELALSRGKSADPQVELLMQSFAFLVGRLQHELDADQAGIPNALLEQLYPHLTAPIPCMAIAQIDVRPDANFTNGQTLARGRQFTATASTDSGRRVVCRLRTCYDTPLWPLKIVSAGLVPTNHYDFLSIGNADVGDAGDQRRRLFRDVTTVLRVQIAATNADPIQQLPLDRLRIHLVGDDTDAYRLYDALAANLAGIAVLVPGDDRPRLLPPKALQWLGFNRSHAALPEGDATSPAYRLLQEYSTFPEKFLFFDVLGLDCREATGEFDLLFLLNHTAALRVADGAMRLNCVPMINLFSQPFEPLRLDHREYEYRLIADQTAHPYCEIYSLEDVRAIAIDGSPRSVAPYFAMEEYGKLERRDYFYATRRAVSQSKRVPGTELFVSLLDMHLNLAEPTQETIGGRALCTNRRLAEQLRAGDVLHLDGPGPVNTARLLAKPTPHRTPHLLGPQPWALMSQLNLNHLSLTARGLEAFKNILRLNMRHDGQRAWKQIDSLLDLQSSPVVRHVGSEHWRGFCRGIGLRINVDEERFDGGSVLLFGEVLRQFFALYANVNSFTQLTLTSQQRKEELKTWPPMAGAQIVL